MESVFFQARDSVEVYVRYFRLNRAYVLRRLNVKIIEDEFRLIIDEACPARDIFSLSSGRLLEARVCYGRAYRIRIRIPVTYYVNFFLQSAFLLVHLVFSL